MFVYLGLWLGVAAFAIVPVRTSRSVKNILYALAAIGLTLFIGLRYEIGGDWFNYIYIHHSITTLPWPAYLLASDPGYALLNRWASDPVSGIYVVNAVCAALFVAGALRFTRDQPLPALALAIVLAYAGIVVAMGYTRQSVAIGLVMFALAELRRGRALRYFGIVVLAVLFHRSALVMLPLGLLKASRGLRWRAGILLALASPILLYLSITAVQGQVEVYVVQGLQSGGGSIRIAMCAIPALLFLGLRGRMRALWPDDAGIWTACSLFALALVPVLAVASTAADRLGLYLVPLQVAVYSRLPYLLRGHWRPAAMVGALGLYGLTLAYWMSTSFFAHCCWIPYRSVL